MFYTPDPEVLNLRCPRESLKEDSLVFNSLDFAPPPGKPLHSGHIGLVGHPSNNRSFRISLLDFKVKSGLRSTHICLLCFGSLTAKPQPDHALRDGRIRVHFTHSFISNAWVHIRCSTNTDQMSSTPCHSLT